MSFRRHRSRVQPRESRTCTEVVAHRRWSHAASFSLSRSRVWGLMSTPSSAGRPRDLSDRRSYCNSRIESRMAEVEAQGRDRLLSMHMDGPLTSAGCMLQPLRRRHACSRRHKVRANIVCYSPMPRTHSSHQQQSAPALVAKALLIASQLIAGDRQRLTAAVCWSSSPKLRSAHAPFENHCPIPARKHIRPSTTC